MKTTIFNDLPHWLDELVDTLIELETWEPAELVAKLAEETGELSEQVFVATGRKSKKLDEPIEGETADVINCAIATFVQVLVRQGASPDAIKQRLMEGMRTKNDKYMRALSRKQDKPARASL